MKFFNLKSAALAFAVALGLCCTIAAVQQTAFCQETTGGMQGTVKDPSGAVIPGATVSVTTATLVGTKQTVSDSAGYYRFANLPPGTYTITAEAKGFETLKRTGIVLEVGHLPTIDLPMKIGGGSSIVEVTTEGPIIDETTTTTLTNIPQQALANLPHGTSYQSVIQFSPGARQEPLMGNSGMGNGSGGTSPGNGSNGGAFGFSIDGGSDSENSYLVEGQETADIIGGYSHTDVPMDFIQEVQMKTSGVDAQYGGALGGVVNVILDKGTDRWHGSIFTTFQDEAMSGSPRPTLRYDPTSGGTPTSWGTIDPAEQIYQPIRPHTSDFFPGITAGGPLIGLLPGLFKTPDSVYSNLSKRIFFFGGFNPEFSPFERTLNYGTAAEGGAGLGKVPFSQNTHTDYAYARIDAEVTQKIRVFASWLSQDQKQWGESLPDSDSVQGYDNVTTGCSGTGSSLSCNGNFIDPSTYSHTFGFGSPNTTTNVGADITLTNSLVSTTRYGYFFQNYHDIGYPTSGDFYEWDADGTTATDTNGTPIATSAPALAENENYVSGAVNQNFTAFNASRATQFDEGIAWYHGGRHNTHNLMFGYQLHRNFNTIDQGYSEPDVQIYPGGTDPYTPSDPAVGVPNCAAVEAQTHSSKCVGTYGNVAVNDYGTSGHASALNHGFYVMDAWTMGGGLTVNAGLRLEHEYLPAENQPATQKFTKPIDFGWGSKIAPRVGVAWDVFRNGKMKIFGSYGKYYDQMKLNLAIGSYGGEIWEQCWFALMEPTYANIDPAFNSAGQYCIGSGTNATVNWASGSTPSGLTFLESLNMRANPTTCSTCTETEEGTAPGLKPYAQHDSSFGVDYLVRPNLAFEARWDRRRLDSAIEDAAIYNPSVGETFVIINPGEGVDTTFNKYWNFLYGTPPDCVSNTCPTAQQQSPAARSYDGIEFRLMKNISEHWMGMFSYTWSNFRGNYSGLSSSDLGDGGGGRNAPNNSRAFDEPYFQFNANGTSSSGLLPTDRPNALKGYAYYDLPWARKFVTDFGITQFAYSGTPLTSELDVGDSAAGQPVFPVDIVDRGKWIDVTQDPTTGAITTSAPYTKRTPWYTDTDFNLKQSFKIGEESTLSFDATFTNMLNEHKVVEYWEEIDSDYSSSNFIMPGGLFIGNGLDFYSAAMSKYDYTADMNTGSLNGTGTGPITIDSKYGKPYGYQVPRNVILGMHITF
ncbi:MAG: carboxypeptidase regulatory-like domain-containing protein [Terracidiphilus sp.]